LSPRQILVFRNAAGEELGNIRPVLESRGFDVRVVDLFDGVPVPDPSNASGLIFMGGPLCANDDVPFLRAEIDLIRSASDRRQPIFGVCLGAQLIAKALGGRVYASASPETGWSDIQLAECARKDRVFAPLAPVETVFQLHQDTFDLPPGATLLASSERGVREAFRCGSAVYGVQFHP